MKIIKTIKQTVRDITLITLRYIMTINRRAGYVIASPYVLQEPVVHVTTAQRRRAYGGGGGGDGGGGVRFRPIRPSRLTIAVSSSLSRD